VKYPQSRIQVFAREPVPGRVKTRLVPLLGEQGAADLHARLVHATLATACRSGLAPVELWCTPARTAGFFRDCRERYAVTLRQQSPGDLGRRMRHAIHDALDHGQSTVLIGTDCPELRSADLEEALVALSGSHGAVLGPARDGGYYLVGLSRPVPGLFDGMEWGTGTVFSDTLGYLLDRSISCHRLAWHDDVDTPDDYRRFIRKTTRFEPSI